MIESLENKKVKDWCRLQLKKYRQENYLLLEEELVTKAKESGHLKTLIYCGRRPFPFAESYEVSAPVMEKIAGEKKRYIGVGTRIEEKAPQGERILLLDELQDPLNVGMIIHSAVLFGFDALVLSQNTADLYHEKCLKASCGDLYELPICRADLFETVKELRKHGYLVYATGLREDTLKLSSAEAKEKMAFILGNEGSGVRPELMSAADATVKIEMENIDSLNVAVAASILMYHFRKR
ncbi:MAG: RNA methyltransferase [Erysipelotrichaceae bacterium]|nr:RNA methyltransferase [Erysipelotrichaceae bacterium]